MLLALTDAHAVPLRLFDGLEKHIKQADDIFIARCISVPLPDEHGWPYEVIFPIEAEILYVLKGTREPGPIRIIVDGSFIPGRQYLVFSPKGGFAYDSDCFAYGELSTVLMPWAYNYKASYGGKPVDLQVREILQDRLHHIKSEESKLIKQKELIIKALGKESEHAPPDGRVEAPRP